MLTTYAYKAKGQRNTTYRAAITSLLGRREAVAVSTAIYVTLFSVCIACERPRRGDASTAASSARGA